MKTSSCKSKGRNFQKYVIERLLLANPELDSDELKSCSMGANGEDVQMSNKIRAKHFSNIFIECKHHKRLSWYAVYKDTKVRADQAAAANKYRAEMSPVVFCKGDRQAGACAIVDAEFLIGLMRRVYELENKLDT